MKKFALLFAGLLMIVPSIPAAAAPAKQAPTQIAAKRCVKFRVVRRCQRRANKKVCVNYRTLCVRKTRKCIRFITLRPKRRCAKFRTLCTKKHRKCIKLGKLFKGKRICLRYRTLCVRKTRKCIRYIGVGKGRRVCKQFRVLCTKKARRCVRYRSKPFCLKWQKIRTCVQWAGA